MSLKFFKYYTNKSKYSSPYSSIRSSLIDATDLNSSSSSISVSSPLEHLRQSKKVKFNNLEKYCFFSLSCSLIKDSIKTLLWFFGKSESLELMFSEKISFKIIIN